MNTGFVVALAWPANMCRQAGAWYDGLMNLLGISKNHYYRVGHAALVLVKSETGECFYFDFGRYHSPFHHGRVRNATTDHLLSFTIAFVFKTKSWSVVAFLTLP